MDDDDVDLELLALLRERLGIKKASDEITPDTGVLRDAEYIYNNAIDVSIDMWSTKSAALKIHKTIQERGYSIAAWSEHELHPRLGPDFDEVQMANFVFTMDLLNFSFWSELSQQDRFQVEYQGKRHTGYMTLVASLQRALEEGTPITTPRFWRSAEFTDEVMRHVFRSATAEEIPLLEERILVLREAGEVLKDFDDEPEAEIDNGRPQAAEPAVEQSIKPDAVSDVQTVTDLSTDKQSHTPANTTDEQTADSSTEAAVSETPDAEWIKVESMQVDDAGAAGTEEEKAVALHRFASNTDTSVKALIQKANGSAGTLVNLLAKHFSSFRDECRYDGRKVRLLKRAQIFVADLNAACNNSGLGHFSDMVNLTMFAGE